jgi:hypothetical protein
MSNQTKELLKLFDQALKSGNEADIELALDEATQEAKLAMSVFSQLGLQFPDAVAKYCRATTEIPSVHSSDESKNKMTASLAKGLGLGKDVAFDYSGDRRKGMVSKLAVERLIDIIKELKTETKNTTVDELESLGEIGNFLSRVKKLPELDADTGNEWKRIMTEYALQWFHAEDKEKASKFSMAFPTIDLVREAQSYAESRLEARRAEKMKALDKQYPNGERLNVLWKNGERRETVDHFMELSNYQSGLAKIESMDFDRDCWKYAIDRLIGEKLERLLRSKGS